MMKTVKVAVTWHKPGEVATARQQVWQMEVPASGETTAEQDLLLTLREDVEWHRTHDAGPMAPLAWASAAVCVIAVIVLTFYPLTPSNVLPLVR